MLDRLAAALRTRVIDDDDEVDYSESTLDDTRKRLCCAEGRDDGKSLVRHRLRPTFGTHGAIPARLLQRERT